MDVFDEFIRKVNLAVKVTRNAFENESKQTEELLKEPQSAIIHRKTGGLLLQRTNSESDEDSNIYDGDLLEFNDTCDSYDIYGVERVD